MKERTQSKVLVITTGLVVLVLAGLLYRWSNQVSESTSVRLADSLQMSMSNWQLTLYRNISDVAGALRIDSENSGNLDLAARRFKEWKASAQYKDVAANLYVLRTDAPARTLQLDLANFTFRPADLPAAMKPLREKLSSLPPSARVNLPTFPRGLAGWKFDPEVPALVRPVDALNGSWMVIELNRQVIDSHIFPDLAKTYFAGTEGLDYFLAVVAGPQNRQVIYSSDPGFGSSDVPDADGRLDIFGKAPMYVFHKVSGNASSLGSQWFPLLDNSSETPNWQLLVRHRQGGPLGAFVTEMHRRDLAISFGVLFLLVALVAMLLVTSFRANRLARLQMDFVTAVSHELRTPLAIINSAAENITHGVVNGKEQVEQYGRVIEGQTRQLTRLVEEVLLFASTRDERHRYNPQPLEVRDVVDTALSSVSDLVKAAQFNIERDIPANLPQVRGDLQALSQCLQNLVTNALKYSGGQRWIGIRASVHDEGASGTEVRISVSDRGIGIAASDLSRIFEPFFRSSAATDAQIHGTGLGLSLARNIAEAMQGRLTVVSEPGKGTTFTLHLRANPATSPTASSLSALKAN
jgi:signal transduction histidine kinase